MTQILRWLHGPGIDELSPYLRASRARTLVADIEADLRWVGVPPGLFAARGTDFWDESTGIARATIRSARHRASDPGTEL